MNFLETFDLQISFWFDFVKIAQKHPRFTTQFDFEFQENPRGKVRNGKIYIHRNKTKLGVNLISLEKIVGLQVITSGAHILGEEKGAQIDPKTWQVKYLEVKLAADAASRLGKKKRFGSSNVCVPVSVVNAVAGVITLTKSLDELESGKDIEESKD